MLARACTVVGIWAILIAAPAWAAGGRYGTDYPVCMEAIDSGGGTHFECSYTSIEQCRQGASGTPGTCFNNPSYVPRPAEAAPAPAEAEPEPAITPKKNAGRYDPDYPVCMEVFDISGGRIECRYTSYEQCRQASIGTSGSCFINPSYVPPPAEPPPAQAAPAPPAKPAKPTKSVKSAKSVKSPQTPASPQPVQSR